MNLLLTILKHSHADTTVRQGFYEGYKAFVRELSADAVRLDVPAWMREYIHPWSLSLVAPTSDVPYLMRDFDTLDDLTDFIERGGVPFLSASTEWKPSVVFVR